MNTAIFSIPSRWQQGAYQIKTWIENYGRAVEQSFEVTIGGETEWEAADNAVHILNNHLNRPKGEPWKARCDAERELEQQLAEIDKIFSASKSEKDV